MLGIATLSLILAAGPATAQTPNVISSMERWQPIIAEASQRFGVPEAWIAAVMRAESGGQTIMLNGHPITSSKGAMGLMQIMPETWTDLRARYGFGADSYDARDNILAGAAYLAELYRRYGYPDLFAAYNAGPARFDAYRFHGTPLPEETRSYLAVLGRPVSEPSRLLAMSSANSLFVVLRTIADNESPPLAPSSMGLFVPLTTVPSKAP